MQFITYLYTPILSHSISSHPIFCRRLPECVQSEDESSDSEYGVDKRKKPGVSPKATADGKGERDEEDYGTDFEDESFLDRRRISADVGSIAELYLSRTDHAVMRVRLDGEEKRRRRRRREFARIYGGMFEQGGVRRRVLFFNTCVVCVCVMRGGLCASNSLFRMFWSDFPGRR